MPFAVPELAVALLLLSAPTRHDAERLFNAGTAAYQAARYEEALADFAASYEALPLAQVLFDIAQCDRKLGRWAEAEVHYRHYLQAVPRALNRAEVRGYLEQARAEQAKAKVVDAASAPVQPAPEPTAPTRSVEALKLEAPPPPPPVAALQAPAPARHPSRGPYWLGGAGVVTALAGGACLIAGEVMQGGDTTTPSGGYTKHTLTAPQVQTINVLLVASYALFGVGGAAVLGAAGWAGSARSSGATP